jgi:hypothetical protein
LWFKEAELSKDGSLAFASAIERTAIKRISHNRSQAMSAREVRVTLTGPMLHHFNTSVVGFQSSYLRSIANIAIKRNAYDRTHMAL